MHYRADESGIRDAKESVDDAKRQLEIDAIEREIDLLEESKNLLNEQIDLLEEQADNIKSFYDAQIKSLEKQKESTEKYFEMLTKSLENSKDKYQELLDIVDKAELSGKLKKLGIDEEALLNGSEEEFEKLKNAYLDVVFQLNEGNEEFLSSLRDLSGYEGTAPVVLSDTAEKLDEVNEQLDTSTESMDKLSDSATTASEGTSAVAENMGELNTNTEGLSDNITNINDALNGLPETDKLEHLVTSFTELGKAIQDVADKLGIGEDGAVSTLVTALQEISTLSLDGTDGEGVITQFQNLKTAIEDVTSAISGGGTSGGQEGDASTSSSPSMSSGAGGDEGASGLLDAIEEIKTTTDESLGGGEGEDSEGEGSGAIPQFHELQAAVDDVTAAIGSEESEGEEGENTLIGALRAQYETASEVLPETKALFEELLESILACVSALNSMVGLIGSMSSIGGFSAESIPTHAEGTVGNAFADGTHYKGLPHDEKNALVSEYGQTEMTVLPNGKTIITDEPTMIDLPKDTVIYNEKQAKKIMDSKPQAIGNAYAGGTVRKDIQVLQSNPYGLSEFDLKLTNALREIDGWDNRDKTIGEDVNSIARNMEQMEKRTREINNSTAINSVTTNKPTVSIGNIHVTCPGVTEQQVAEKLGGVIGKELDKQFSGFHNYTDQLSRIR